jgi:hypothetical protein
LGAEVGWRLGVVADAHGIPFALTL